MNLDLGGKHVFIAGASRGIGEAMARAFLTEGAKVALTARTPGPLEDTYAGFAKEFGAANVWRFAGDMTKTADIEAALDGAERALGPVHCAIANVGIDKAPLGIDVSDDQWEAGIAQNFLSATRLARTALKRILARPRDTRADANVILISSIAGLGALGTPLTYGTMKAAVNHAMREMAKLVGKEGVRVNAIAPGNIIFPGGDWQARVDARPDDWGRWIKREVALRRFGKAEEIANAALFVASPRASFVTGEIFTVDGGQTK